MIHLGDVHKEETNIKFWVEKTGNMNDMDQFLLDGTVGFFTSSPGSHDELISARGMLLQTFTSLHLLPSLSSPSLCPPSHTETEEP